MTERSFYCTFDELKRIVDSSVIRYDKTQRKILQAFDKIVAFSEKRISFPSEEEYIAQNRGDIHTTPSDFKEVEQLERIHSLPQIKVLHYDDSFSFAENDSNSSDIFTSEFLTKKECSIKKCEEYGYYVLKNDGFAPLQRSWNSYIFENKEFKWSYIFNRDKTPSNASIFVDRYLFRGHERNQSPQHNIKDILYNLIKSGFTDVYHLLIVTSLSDKNSDITQAKEWILEKANDTAEIVRSGLVKNKKFELLIEYIWISSNSKLYKETHNRRIFSNYYTIMADHSLVAVRKDKEKGLIAAKKQNIEVKFLFSNLDNRYDLKKEIKTNTNIPIVWTRNEIHELYELFSNSNDEKDLICVSSHINTTKCTTDLITKEEIKNRLFLSN